MKTAIIANLKIVAALILFPTMALGVTVGPLPPCEFADTEVSTNIPFQVNFGTMSRIELTLSLDVSATNSIEVWIGSDANESGELSLDEAEHVFGYDCRMWFHRDAVIDGLTQGNQPLLGTASRIERKFVLHKKRMQPSWNLVKVVRRGVAEIGEIVVVEGKMPGILLIVR